MVAAWALTVAVVLALMALPAVTPLGALTVLVPQGARGYLLLQVVRLQRQSPSGRHQEYRQGHQEAPHLSV